MSTPTLTSIIDLRGFLTSLSAHLAEEARQTAELQALVLQLNEGEVPAGWSDDLTVLRTLIQLVEQRGEHYVETGNSLLHLARGQENSEHQAQLLELYQVTRNLGLTDWRALLKPVTP